MAGPVPQIKCEVCETVQLPASLCANCGVPLRLPPGVAPVADLPIERVEGFEPTILGSIGRVAEERILELEPTIQAPAPAVATDFVPGFETTEEPLVIDLPGEDETVPDLERTVEEFEKTAVAPGSEGRCQYCGFVQASGRICNNCGLARSKVLGGATPVRGEVGRTRCPACGSLVLQREHCSDCGQPLPQEER